MPTDRGTGNGPWASACSMESGPPGIEPAGKHLSRKDKAKPMDKSRFFMGCTRRTVGFERSCGFKRGIAVAQAEKARAVENGLNRRAKTQALL